MPLPSKTTTSGAALDGEARAFGHVRHERPPGEPAAGTAAADRDDAGHGRDLEVVGGGVAAGARESDELVDARRRLDRLGLGRSATTHRHDDDVPVAGEKPREVRRDRGLADPLSGSDHGDRGHVDLARRQAGRSGSRRRCTRARQRARGRPSRSGRRARAPARRRGRRRLRLRRSRREAGLRSRRPLGASRSPRRGSLRPIRTAGRAGRRRTTSARMLAVDQRDRSHRGAVTSPSIREVYFSYSSVSRSNWMIRSCPWNG